MGIRVMIRVRERLYGKSDLGNGLMGLAIGFVGLGFGYR